MSEDRELRKVRTVVQAALTAVADTMGIDQDRYGVYTLRGSDACYLVEDEDGAPLCTRDETGEEAMVVCENGQTANRLAFSNAGVSFGTNWSMAFAVAQVHRLPIYCYFANGKEGILIWTATLPDSRKSADSEADLPF